MSKPTTPSSHQASKDRELREKLATIEHERWADWQKWMHSLTKELPLGARGVFRVIPDVYFERWERQIATPYSELSDKEKISDREQVDRYWPLIEAYVDSLKQSLVAEKRALLFSDGKTFEEAVPIEAINRVFDGRM